LYRQKLCMPNRIRIRNTPNFAYPNLNIDSSSYQKFGQEIFFVKIKIDFLLEKSYFAILETT